MNKKQQDRLQKMKLKHKDNPRVLNYISSVEYGIPANVEVLLKALEDG